MVVRACCTSCAAGVPRIGEHMSDFVDDVLSAMGGGPSVSGFLPSDVERMVSGLVEVGALEEVGAEAVRQAAAGAPANQLRSVLQRAAQMAQSRIGKAKPAPTFARSARETTRRAALGFQEQTSGARFFTLPAVIGASTIMIGKVSRKAHTDRLLIIPSAPGAILMSIKVGDEEQLLNPGAPVELYGEAALTDSLPDNFSPLESALDMLIQLQNTTAVAITGTIGLKAGVER